MRWAVDGEARIVPLWAVCGPVVGGVGVGVALGVRWG